MQFFLSLGAVNLLLVSCYLLPLWARDALLVLNSPFGGLQNPSHAAAVGPISDFLGFEFDGILLVSKLLAGLKLLAVAAMVAFLIEFVRAIAERREPDRATVNTVLLLASISILPLALPAMTVRDMAIIHDYAAQIMLVCGAVVVATIEREVGGRVPAAQSSAPVAHEEPVEQRLAA